MSSWLQKKEIGLGPTHGSAKCTGTTLWMSAPCEPHSRMTLRESDNGQKFNLHIFLRRGGDQSYGYIPISGLWLKGCWIIRDLERMQLEYGDKEVGGSMWTHLIEWAPSKKIFVFHVNTQQRVIPAEEDLNNKVERGTCFVNVSGSPSLTTPCYHCAQDNKVVVAGGRLCTGSVSNRSFSSPRPTGLQPLQSAHTAFHIAFHVGSASAKTTIYELIECLSVIMAFTQHHLWPRKSVHSK